MDSLSRTSASFLTSRSPVKSTSAPPAFKPVTISPQRHTSRYAELFARPTASAREQELLDALAECDQRDETRKGVMIQMQVAVVLAGMYLQAAEERKANKKTRRKMGDGKAKWFTSDTFIQMCIDDDERKEAEAAGKVKRKTERAARAAELAEWKKQNELIRGRNELEVDKAAWEVEKELAKTEKRRPAWQKPKWKDYEPEALFPRPKKADEEDSGGSGDEGSENGSGMEDD
ncbi:hypothetical protein B0H13DRAFT_1850724 [Mycena leptocephala]|nr:hypothetical protein B0H13DRAFT_1850724 [Mycena leptocephala]